MGLRPTDLVFPTAKGGPDCRQNVRRRLLLPAIEKANVKLSGQGIEAIADDVGLHGLRRTFASLRTAAGDDPVYVAGQLGHEDPTFTLKVYEPLRESCRLRRLRGWGDVKHIAEVFARGS